MKNIIASLIFFTRIPLWRFKTFQLPAKYFENVINYWSVIGWLTGGTMAMTLWLSSQILPLSVSIILAFISRLLLTGALHEDGLADFFDGIGGGTSSKRILEIMKDSHIGTYGVLGLLLYFALFFMTLFSFNDVKTMCIFVLIADPFSKFIASNITLFLPYARTSETSKSGVVYKKMKIFSFIIAIFFGLFPLLLVKNGIYLGALLLPILVFFTIIFLLKKKLGGYTGDTCGALFLLCELSLLIGFLIIYLNF